MLQFYAFSYAFEQSLNDQHYIWLLLEKTDEGDNVSACAGYYVVIFVIYLV